MTVEYDADRLPGLGAEEADDGVFRCGRFAGGGDEGEGMGGSDGDELEGVTVELLDLYEPGDEREERDERKRRPTSGHKVDPRSCSSKGGCSLTVKLTGKTSSNGSLEAGASFSASAGAVRPGASARTANLIARTRTCNCAVRQAERRHVGSHRSLLLVSKVQPAQRLERSQPKSWRIEYAYDLLVGTADELQALGGGGEGDGSERVAVDLRSTEFCSRVS